jgi:hypothetical protein
MPGRINKRNGMPFMLDPVGSDVLRDSAGLSIYDF